jgi:hypothetical protein
VDGHESRHQRQQLLEGARDGLHVVAGRFRLAHVVVEEVDGRVAEVLHVAHVAHGLREQLLEWKAGLEQGEAEPGHLEVRLAEALLAFSAERLHQARRDRRLDQRLGDARLRRQLPPRQAALADTFLDQGRQQRLGLRAGFGPGHHPADLREAESLSLQIADAPQAFQMGVAVVGDAALATRRRQQAPPLVEAQGVDPHPGRNGELFHSIIHAIIL